MIRHTKMRRTMMHHTMMCGDALGGAGLRSLCVLVPHLHHAARKGVKLERKCLYVCARQSACMCTCAALMIPFQISPLIHASRGNPVGMIFFPLAVAATKMCGPGLARKLGCFDAGLCPERLGRSQDKMAMA